MDCSGLVENLCLSDSTTLVTKNDTVYFFGGYSSQHTYQERKENVPLDLIGKIVFDNNLEAVTLSTKTLGVGFASGFAFLPNQNTVFITCGNISR